MENQYSPPKSKLVEKRLVLKSMRDAAIADIIGQLLFSWGYIKAGFYIISDIPGKPRESAAIYEPISKLEILFLDEARAFRKAEFTRSK